MKLAHSMSGQDARRSTAFTLIELILAIGIMAIVLVAINAVFFSALRLRERSVATVEESLPIQQTLAILRRDLQGAMPVSSNGILAGTFKAGSVSTIGSSFPLNLEFNTTTGVLRDNEPWGEIQKVGYGLRSSANRNVPGNDLYRSVTRNLLAAITPQPEEQWMMGGVQSMEISCYDGSQWRSDWDTSITDTNLPTAVRVRILLVSSGSSTPRPVEMIVPIDSQSLTNQSTTTTTTE